MPTAPRRLQRSKEERINWIESIPFILIHVAALAGIIWVKPTWHTALWGVFRYYSGMFLVTGVYHRYFSHRSYTMNRVWQFVAAFLACANAQKGPIWWSGMHEWHHLYADEQPDWHTPWKDFWWAHVGWILCDATKVAPARFTRRWDEERFPELNWLDRNYLVPPILLGVMTFVLGGWSGLFWSFIIPTVALYHGTFFINSLAHLPWLGTRRFDVPNTSRNIWWLWPITLGENYHNNHHHERWNPQRQGIRWWEIPIPTSPRSETDQLDSDPLDHAQQDRPASLDGYAHCQRSQTSFREGAAHRITAHNYARATPSVQSGTERRTRVGPEWGGAPRSARGDIEQRGAHP